MIFEKSEFFFPVKKTQPESEREEKVNNAPLPPSEKGTSGIRHTSTTPEDSDACVAIKPDCLPISLTIARPRNALEASTFAASRARCASSTAVSKPKQRSMSRMSLSIDLGTPMTAQVTLFLTHSVAFLRWIGGGRGRERRGRGRKSEFFNLGTPTFRQIKPVKTKRAVVNRRSSRIPAVPPDDKHHVDSLPRDGLNDLGDVRASPRGPQNRPALELDTLDGGRGQLHGLAGLVVKPFQAVAYPDDVLDAVASGELLREGLDDVIEARAEAAAGDDCRLVI